jgi:large subunit ribosomal protein L9
MELILLKDVENVGLKGEVVEVARGYARNYLLPRQLAQVATPGALADVRRRDESRARQQAATTDQAQALAEKLAKVELRFDVQSGPTGTLFGSVTPTDIADEIWKLEKIRVDRRKIGIDPIKRIGRYSIPIELFQDVDVEVKAIVVPEGGELPPEEELAAEAEAAGVDAAIAAAAAQDFEPSDEDELEETPEMHAQERPDDEFDRVTDAAVETERDQI